MKIEKTAGFVTKVGDLEVGEVLLPDWSLSYIEFPKEKKAEYWQALRQAGVKIQRVFPTRIYFEER